MPFTIFWKLKLTGVPAHTELASASVLPGLGNPVHCGFGTQLTFALQPAAGPLASEVNLMVKAPDPSEDTSVGIDKVPDEGPYKMGEEVEAPS